MTIEQTHDGLLHGSILRAVMRLALPVMGGMLLQTTFNLVDIWWVAHLGAASVAGISASGFVVWAVFALCGMVGIGVNAMVARFAGARWPEEATRVAVQGLILAALISLVIGAAGLIFRHQLFDLMQTREEVTQAGLRYLSVVFAGAPVLFLHFTVNAIFRGVGDTLTPLKILGFAVGINMIADPLLIFGVGPFPRLEEAGAGVSTVLSRMIALILGLYCLYKGRGNRRLDWQGITFRFVPKMWIRILRIGVPASTSGFLFCVVYVLLTRTTAWFGTEAVAALGLGHRIESFAYVIAVGLSTAAATLVGQNLGAGQPQRASRCAWTTAGISSAFMAVFVVLYFSVPNTLISLFISDSLVIEMGALYLWVIAFSQIFDGIALAIEGSFSGAGDTIPPMVINMPLHLARLPIASLLAITLDWGIIGVWWAISATSIVKCLLLTVWFLRGRWKLKRV